MKLVDGDILNPAVDLQREQHAAGLVAVLESAVTGVPGDGAGLLIAQTQAGTGGAGHCFRLVLTFEERPCRAAVAGEDADAAGNQRSVCSGGISASVATTDPLEFPVIAAQACLAADESCC